MEFLTTLIRLIACQDLHTIFMSRTKKNKDLETEKKSCLEMKLN